MRWTLIVLLLLSTAAEANCKGMRGCVSEADAAKRTEQDRQWWAQTQQQLAKEREQRQQDMEEQRRANDAAEYRQRNPVVEPLPDAFETCRQMNAQNNWDIDCYSLYKEEAGPRLRIHIIVQ